MKKDYLSQLKNLFESDMPYSAIMFCLFYYYNIQDFAI